VSGLSFFEKKEVNCYVIKVFIEDKIAWKVTFQQITIDVLKETSISQKEKGKK
jgi:hypothetical protein